MIDQKQAIQLIGTWGYTPKQFMNYINAQLDRAKKIGEAVGGTTYSSMSAFCKYAMTGDADESVRSDTMNVNNAKLRKQIREILDEELDDILDKDDFSEGVIDAIYDSLKDCKNIREAEISLRQKVMFSVAPIVAKSVADFGGKVAEEVLELFVGADNASQFEEGKANELCRIVAKNLQGFIGSVAKYIKEIKYCKETPLEEFNLIADALIGDIDDIMLEIDHDVMSIIGKPPHVWARYSIKFGKLMAGFVLAMSFGYVTYDDYEKIVDDFKAAIRLSPVETKPNISFGRN